MDTLVKTGAQVKFEFGMGTVFATIRGKVWKCEGEGVPEEALRIYERALQGRVKEDLGVQPPLASRAYDNIIARSAAKRSCGIVIYLDERPDSSPQYTEDGVMIIY
ncbi:MAG: hypothetical protein NT023_09580 [Armatimonadetes bacterium]|nr:hypothetical protein [Armatimonadota bacterium]